MTARMAVAVAELAEVAVGTTVASMEEFVGPVEFDLLGTVLVVLPS